MGVSREVVRGVELGALREQQVPLTTERLSSPDCSILDELSNGIALLCCSLFAGPVLCEKAENYSVCIT